ncbi:MAG: transporter [Trichlorobacter sp.]
MTALRSTITALTFALLTAHTALAGPPLITDDAGTVAVGKAELELNGSYTHDKETSGGIACETNATDAEMKISTGLHKDLGISLAIPYTIRAREKEDGALTGTSDGLGDMTLEVKYAFAELADLNLAIKPSLVAPTGRYSKGLSEGHWHGGLTLIASKEFADGAYALHANLGYEHHRYRTQTLRSTTHGNLWSGSIAGEAEVTKGLVMVADLGLASNPDKGSGELPVYALTGARYEINDLLDINAGVKFGLTGAEDDVTALYGLVLKF